MKKKWKIFDNDHCPNCGNDVEVLSSCQEDGWVYGGEDARCASKCGFTGVTGVSEEGFACIIESTEF